MEQIRSKRHRLLHIIFRLSDFTSGRTDLILPDNMLQCAAMKLQKGKKFEAHKHLSRMRELDVKAQEAWIVINGSVRGYYYDIDGELLSSTKLYAGDVSITLNGGHNFEILEENTLCYEFKTGPYEGQLLDKEFI